MTSKELQHFINSGNTSQTPQDVLDEFLETLADTTVLIAIEEEMPNRFDDEVDEDYAEQTELEDDILLYQEYIRQYGNRWLMSSEVEGIA